MRQGGFIGRNFRGGDSLKGEFTEGGFSYYQFSEWRSAFKHVGMMTVVHKQTVFDKQCL